MENCCLRLQLMNGFLTFWAILATLHFCGNGKRDEQKTLPKAARGIFLLWAIFFALGRLWADGAIWHMVSSSKTLLSEISPKLEPLILSLEICPILTSVGSLGWQQKNYQMSNPLKRFQNRKTSLCLTNYCTCTD